MDITKVEKIIGTPSKDWKGRCYEIAARMLKKKIVEGKLRYGHWLGPITKGTLFYNRGPITRHGWIEMKDGTIIDPTRWVFENKKPYIFMGKDMTKFYDVGGQEWRKANMNPPPIFDNSKEIKLDVSVETYQYLIGLLSYEYLTTKGLFWIANLSTDILGDFAKEIYGALEKVNMSVFIPIDNYDLIMKG